MVCRPLLYAPLELCAITMMIDMLRGMLVAPSEVSMLVVMAAVLRAMWSAPSELLPGLVVSRWGEVVGWGLICLMSSRWCHRRWWRVDGTPVSIYCLTCGKVRHVRGLVGPPSIFWILRQCWHMMTWTSYLRQMETIQWNLWHVLPLFLLCKPCGTDSVMVCFLSTICTIHVVPVSCASQGFRRQLPLFPAVPAVLSNSQMYR